MTCIVAVDQGTTSTRALVVGRDGAVLGSGQAEHHQHFPAPGWVEHDALEIWEKTRQVVGVALAQANITRDDVAAVGITNQRETVVAWNPATGEPYARALVWQDTRTQPLIDELTARYGRDTWVPITGLPLDAYFSASKMRWLLDHVEDGQGKAERGELLLGTMDSWLVWNLTGGVQGGVHITDVTNASRTLLMDLRSRQWSPELLEVFTIPERALPQIRPSSDAFGVAGEHSLLAGVPIAGVLGDQQAAAFGQAAFHAGDSKATYGTGSFVLANTGPVPVRSSHGLITTVAYELAGQSPVYALEGSIAVTGALIQWLRDSLGMLTSAQESGVLAAQVPNSGGVVIVPAFSGLLAPHWRADARGTITGLTRFTDRRHVARAALEAVAMQTREVLDAMAADTGHPLASLKVDGGMVANDVLMQIQADALGIPVVRPRITETTAMGAAFAAGLGVGVWSGLEDLQGMWAPDRSWQPESSEQERADALARWRAGVERSLGWVP
ncbi:glycerol kinase GlpK [Demequina sp. B12]|uniref:glycerol kinase GlpK n=1 Tax=Demequina sp. B12 TaxID=2992757 RepID=UPI00237BB39A|nr:glycerol kinase GlpK [Demequina sp. B12]MDE0572106.1 glycerol kinase GlpK [Demequina sp. B12]